jgi:hypothetical protein
MVADTHHHCTGSIEPYPHFCPKLRRSAIYLSRILMIEERNKYQDLLVIVVGFSLIGLLMLKGYDKPHGIYFIYAALGLGVVGIFSETVTTYVTKGWQKFGMLLGKINATVLLSVIFILMMIPMAVLKRIFSGKEESGQSSNWTEAEPAMDFTKPW